MYERIRQGIAFRVWVEKAQSSWEFFCPAEAGGFLEIRLNLKDDRPRNSILHWKGDPPRNFRFVYEAGQLRPLHVHSVWLRVVEGRPARWEVETDYSGDAVYTKLYTFPAEMRQICPNGW